MIVKNVKTGKYEIIESHNLHSYDFNVIFSKYNINILSPLRPIHLLLAEKLIHVYK
jgi:hypothetical protein